ncbi:hypothetical protein OsI_23781 [Oryza sativa Indica Group]|uniref:Sulfotransferase n=2 Tax=Oryza TaxID=4527 RepID=A0A0D3GIV0_9ORYZ|nr:hypothetical protein OsI_23781 [Oryza sativa Indica Group]
MKALFYATVHRREQPAGAANHPFHSLDPHKCVEFSEYHVYQENKVPNLDKLPDPRLFATHLPFELLPRAVVAPAPPATPRCNIVYVWRDPKDNMIALTQFMNKYIAWSDGGGELFPVDAAVDFFHDGKIPYWEHILDYWDARQVVPERVLFFRYEEMMMDPAAHLRRLVESRVSRSASSEEEDGDVVDVIVSLCSVSNMTSLES